MQLGTMTDPTPASNPQSNDGAPTPFVETVAKPNASDANRYATHSVARSKTGRGTMITLFVVAPLLVIGIIFAFAAMFLGKTNSDNEQGAPRDTRGTNITQPRSE